jgi:hypothetical protein
MRHGKRKRRMIVPIKRDHDEWKFGVAHAPPIDCRCRQRVPFVGSGTQGAVVATEPLTKDSPLLGRANLILTPHTAFYSLESLDELQTKCASDVARVLNGEQPIYPVKQ